MWFLAKRCGGSLFRWEKQLVFKGFLVLMKWLLFFAIMLFTKIIIRLQQFNCQYFLYLIYKNKH